MRWGRPARRGRHITINEPPCAAPASAGAMPGCQGTVTIDDVMFF
jgi:hypothetical protein